MVAFRSLVQVFPHFACFQYPALLFRCVTLSLLPHPLYSGAQKWFFSPENWCGLNFAQQQFYIISIKGFFLWSLRIRFFQLHINRCAEAAFTVVVWQSNSRGSKVMTSFDYSVGAIGPLTSAKLPISDCEHYCVSHINLHGELFSGCLSAPL